MPVKMPKAKNQIADKTIPMRRQPFIAIALPLMA
jgi:hypothetical protein